MGAIFGLSKPYEWQNDPDHTAIEVGAVWREIFDNLEKCSDMASFRQSDDCTLQASFDGGSTWETIFNALDCVYGGIIDKIDDGTLSPGGQQGAAGTGEPNVCYNWKVKLDGNGRWQCPMKVDNGDTITVSNVSGAWYDGAVYPVGPWNCADGLIFAAGGCGGGGSTQGTDPAPSVDHMRLIGNAANESPAFFDMYNTAITLSGAAGQDFFLQPNDSVLSDNQGSITFDVQLCKGDAWITFCGGRATPSGPDADGYFTYVSVFDSGAGGYVVDLEANCDSNKCFKVADYTVTAGSIEYVDGVQCNGSAIAPGGSIPINVSARGMFTQNSSSSFTLKIRGRQSGTW